MTSGVDDAWHARRTWPLVGGGGGVDTPIDFVAQDVRTQGHPDLHALPCLYGPAD